MDKAQIQEYQAWMYLQILDHLLNYNEMDTIFVGEFEDFMTDRCLEWIEDHK